ncbi:MAG: glycosyltransferase family 2 protein [Deltaproteobacteria bacterium]|nr:glycosyltransferase family 2 protein [Deltaproteobacteria bacterium]MCL5879550.1 glycosyltransferase family 2 protein [Deltaproteobacteria bacterium]
MKLYKGKISILMPAYNEGDRIYDNLLKSCEVFRKFRFPFEILAIDDGSSDNTKDEIKRAGSCRSEIKLIENKTNLGKGFALKNGFLNATGNIIVFLDSDLEINPFQVGDLLKAMRDSDSEIAIGSKRHSKSNINYPFSRKILSTGYYIMIRLLFNLPVKDTQSGIKAYRRDVLDKVFPKILCKKYAFDVEILANAVRNGYKIVEVPIKVVFSRKNNMGRIKIKDIADIWIDTLAIWYRMKLIKYYD